MNEHEIKEKVKDICQEALDNTEITSEILCEDTHDYYLLGKVDLAKEILKELNKKPKEIPQKGVSYLYSYEWVKGYNKWLKQNKKCKEVDEDELGLPKSDEPTPIREDE